MTKWWLAAALQVLCIVGFAQDSLFQVLMDSGIVLHDRGEYTSAIKYYDKALLIEPNNGFAHYEKALSHNALGNVKTAFKHAKRASKEDTENGLQAFILLGSMYDQAGKYKQSVKSLKRGIERFGDYYLLWYNLGVTASGNNDMELAISAFEHAIKGKLDHANSHFALGRIMLANERRVDALYPLLFCAMLEPKSDRSVAVYKAIEGIFAFGVDSTASGNIEVRLPDNKTGSSSRNAEVMMSLLQASRHLEQYQGMPEEEVDREIMMSFLKYMQQAEASASPDLYGGYYIPLFGAIAGSEYNEAFFHYIRMSRSTASRDWCEENINKLQLFFDWLDNLSFEWEVATARKSK